MSYKEAEQAVKPRRRAAIGARAGAFDPLAAAGRQKRLHRTLAAVGQGDGEHLCPGVRPPDGLPGHGAEVPGGHTLVACPSMYLVVECTTMSAPHSNGRQFSSASTSVSPEESVTGFSPVIARELTSPPEAGQSEFILL